MRFSKIKFGHICSIMILVALLVFSYMFYIKEGMSPPSLQPNEPLPKATKSWQKKENLIKEANNCIPNCKKYHGNNKSELNKCLAHCTKLDNILSSSYGL